MPDRYIFNTKPNSYFQGQDVRIEDTETHETVLVNLKDRMWAVEVKDTTLRSELPADVQNALDWLSEGVSEALYEEGKEDFWRGAHDAAQENGFDRVYTAGRSGGWMAVAGTEGWEPADLFDLTNESTLSFLKLAFSTPNLMEGAHSYYFERVREAMAELQVELSEFADWVGAEIRTLDGDIIKVTKLDIAHGRAALRSGFSSFSFATEATLVRKADGQVPARVTADPIMEQVFRIIEARGDLTSEQINDWLDADDDHDPNELYVEHVAPAVNSIEDAIKTDVEAKA